MSNVTDELMKTLKSTPDIDHYIEENSYAFIDKELWQYVNDLLIKKNLTIAKAAQQAQMSDSYLYKINQGRKTNISRDKIIQLCFGLELNIDESKQFMRIAKVGELYPRIRRDSIILFCLENKIDIIECDRRLEEAGDKTLLNE